MANGQQAAEQNLAAFIAWSVSKSDDDFQDCQRLNSLENAALRAELAQAKATLERYKLLSSFMEETGLIKA